MVSANTSLWYQRYSHTGHMYASFLSMAASVAASVGVISMSCVFGGGRRIESAIAVARLAAHVRADLMPLLIVARTATTLAVVAFQTLRMPFLHFDLSAEGLRAARLSSLRCLLSLFHCLIEGHCSARTHHRRNTQPNYMSASTSTGGGGTRLNSRLLEWRGWQSSSCLSPTFWISQKCSARQRWWCCVSSLSLMRTWVWG